MARWRILIVEDEQHVRDVFAEFLTGLGHQVTSMPSGREAIEHLSHGGVTYDVALVDWHMPGIAGRDVIDSIRDLSPETAIVITTGQSQDAVRKARHAAGTVGVLQKPFPLRKLAIWMDKAATGQRLD